MADKESKIKKEEEKLRQLMEQQTIKQNQEQEKLRKKEQDLLDMKK